MRNRRGITGSVIFLLYLAAVGCAALGYYKFGRTAMGFTNHGPLTLPMATKWLFSDWKAWGCLGV